MNRSILRKYLTGQCSTQEASELLEWLKKHGNNQDAKQLLREAWDNDTGIVEGGNEITERILDRIHQKINLDSTRKLLEEKPPRNIGWMLRAAGVALLLISIGFAIPGSIANPFWKQEMDWVHIESPTGARVHFTLPDGSEVWLNSDSRLHYPTEFKDDVRMVKLEGEAFVHVAKNESNPFQVIAGPLGILATGTAFNVSAYPDDQEIATSLVSGSVTIQSRTANDKYLPLYKLKPNQHGVFRRDDSKLKIHEEGIIKYISWKDGKVMFNNDPIDRVLEKLSRIYNVDFEFIDKHVTKYTYTATFLDETLDQVLKLLSMATPITTTTVPRERLPDGSFTKTKVEIRQKKI